MLKALTLGSTGRLALAAAALVLVPVAEAGGPYSFYSLSPCRLVDTRGANGPAGGPALQSNLVRSFPVLGAVGSCNVPSTAKAVAFNITIDGRQTRSTSADLRLFPAGQTAPLASTINFVSNDIIANGAIVPLGDSSGNHLSILFDDWSTYPATGSTTTHVIIDVTGYFE